MGVYRVVFGTFNQWQRVCHRKLQQPQPANDSLALGRLAGEAGVRLGNLRG